MVKDDEATNRTEARMMRAGCQPHGCGNPWDTVALGRKGWETGGSKPLGPG